jgi:hypothetical protein
VELNKLAGAVAAATVMFSVCAVGPANAADGQMFGLQQTINDANGGEIGYTVTKLLPSGDAIPYPVSGQLYEVTVRADALNGLVTPAIGAFSAQGGSGQNYPALAGVWTPQGLSGMTLLPGGHSSGKIYFDAVGEPPTNVVYNGAGEVLTWIEPPVTPPSEKPAPEKSQSGGDESGAAPESESADSGAADSEANGDVAAADEEG